MSVIRFRSPVLKPLLRANAALPADRTSVFRVTQQFNSRDFYWNDGRTHQATDIGDFQCGSAIVAMAPGTAYAIKDNASSLGAPTDALGVRIDHGQGITTEYWHLGGYTVGIVQQVVAGQQIGIVGNTGLGQVCHCHIEAKRNGVKFDPEPLMFGGSIGEDDVQYPRPMYPLALVTVGAGNNLRRTPSLTAEAKLLTADAQVGVHGVVTGEAWADKGSEWLWVGHLREMWCVHSALVTNLRPTVTLQTLGLNAAADCTAQVTAARQATASKNEAQVQAWVATRPPIVP